MYGLLFDCLEKYVVHQHGKATWLELLKDVNASGSTNYGKWVTNENYPDETYLEFISLLASKVELSFDVVSEKLGYYFIDYIRRKGYDELLRCQGKSLCEWIARVNDLHAQLRIADDQGELAFPEIYCICAEKQLDSAGEHADIAVPDNLSMPEKVSKETGELQSNPSTFVPLLLYYKSKRGTKLAQWFVGLIKAASVKYFNLDVSFLQLKTQGEDGSEFTVWRIEGTLRQSRTINGDHGQVQETENSASASHVRINSGGVTCPFSGKQLSPVTSLAKEFASDCVRTSSDADRQLSIGEPVGLSGAQMVDVFPYHIGLNKDFVITQVGSKLRTCFPSDIVGTRIAELFRITEPVECPWDWRKVELCRDSTFELELIDKQREGAFSYRLYGGLLLTSQHHPAGGLVDSRSSDGSGGRSSGGGSVHGFLLLKPFVQSVKEMSDNNLTWSDFGRYSSQQRLILLAEHLKAETAHALKSQQEAILTQQSLEMKRMFVRYVSHEIRTPLNTVSMGLDLIQSLRPSPAAEDDALGIFSMADEIKESCNIAIGILNDLLLYEKLEGGILTLSKKCEPALAVVHEAVRPFTIQAKAVNVDLELSLDSSVFGSDELTSPTVFIDVDKAKMSQVVRNLVSNAIKFSACPAVSTSTKSDNTTQNSTGSFFKKVFVHVSAIDCDADASSTDSPSAAQSPKENHNHPRSPVRSYRSKGNHSPTGATTSSASPPAGENRKEDRGRCLGQKKVLRIEVIDQGPGISEPNQLMLFNQIVQFDPNKLQGGNGSGLGLYISKGIMDLHDGSIGVFSEGEGLGSCFWVDIPLHKADEPCSCPLDEAQCSAASSSTPPKNSSENSSANKAGTPTQSDEFCAQRFLNEWHDHRTSAMMIIAARKRKTSTHSSSGGIPTACAAASTPLSKIARKRIVPASPKFIVPLFTARKAGAAGDRPAHSVSLDTLPRRLVEEAYPSSSISSTSSLAPANHILSASGTVTRRASVRNAHVHPLPPAFIEAVPKYRVLVVDDSMANRKMTSRFLRMSKITEAIVEAEDGLEAVAAVKKSMGQGEKEFDVILMDYVMPEMDGPTATKAIRALGYKGLLVGVTGNLLPEDTELFMSSGATAVMGKPLDMKELKYLLMKSIVASNPSVRSSFVSRCPTPNGELSLRVEAEAATRKGDGSGGDTGGALNSSFSARTTDNSFAPISRYPSSCIAPHSHAAAGIRVAGCALYPDQNPSNWSHDLVKPLPAHKGFRCIHCGEINSLRLFEGKMAPPPSTKDSASHIQPISELSSPYHHDCNDDVDGFRSPTAISSNHYGGANTPGGGFGDEVMLMTRNTPRFEENDIHAMASSSRDRSPLTAPNRNRTPTNRGVSGSNSPYRQKKATMTTNKKEKSSRKKGRGSGGDLGEEAKDEFDLHHLLHHKNVDESQEKERDSGGAKTKANGLRKISSPIDSPRPSLSALSLLSPRMALATVNFFGLIQRGPSSMRVNPMTVTGKEGGTADRRGSGAAANPQAAPSQQQVVSNAPSGATVMSPPRWLSWRPNKKVEVELSSNLSPVQPAGSPHRGINDDARARRPSMGAQAQESGRHKHDKRRMTWLHF